jgi:Skp family chaperone for outer membrane proteins
MRTKTLFCAAVGLILLFLAVSPGRAQLQQTSSIAVFDFQKTVQESIPGRNAIRQINAKEQAIVTELDKIDKQILSFETKLNTQRLTLTTEARQKLSLDIENMQIKRKRYQEDSAREYQDLHLRLMNKLRSEVLAVIQELANEKKFSLVLDVNSGGVAYFSEQFDITQDVIEYYNASKKK